MITKIPTIDIANTSKSIEPIVKSKEKDFNIVLNKFKLNYLNTDKKINEISVDTKKGSNVDIKKLIKDLLDNSSGDINKILIMFQALISGNLSAQYFVDKFKTEPNVQEVLDLIKDNIDDINLIAENDLSMQNIKNNILSNDSLKDDLLYIFNSYIEKYENGTKLSEFEDIEPYILNNFVSIEENSDLKVDIKNAINSLLQESSDNKSDSSDVKEHNFIDEVPKDIYEVKVEKSEIPNDISKIKVVKNEEPNDVPKIKVENSKVAKDDLNSESEEKLLNEFISNDKEPKYNKITTIMSQLTRAEDNNVVSVGDNLFISKDNIAGDIIKAVKYMEVNNIKNLAVKVVPKELGKVVISLTMESGLMKANILATNKETVNILNSNLQQLNNKLNNVDIKIQDFTVDIYNGDTNFLKEESNDNNQNTSGDKSSKINNNNLLEDESQIDDINVIEEQGNVNILA